MFSGIPGARLGVPFFENVIACASGALLSAAFFFFLSEQVIAYQERRRNQLDKQGKNNSKKKFTRVNKWVIRIKSTFGVVGLTFFAPLFLTVPFGAILCAKFFGDNKYTFPLIAMWIGINAIILNLIWYGLFG